MRSSAGRIRSAATAALALALLAGCATPSQPAAMTPAPLAVGRQHPRTVAITVTGGSATSALGASQIANTDFETALRTAIEQSRVFAALKPAAEADYVLEAALVRLDQPTWGAAMKVTLQTSWSLRRRGETAAVWDQAITRSFTASAGAAFAGATRLRLANEGAARENIEEALQQIAALELK